MIYHLPQLDNEDILCILLILNYVEFTWTQRLFLDSKSAY